MSIMDWHGESILNVRVIVSELYSEDIVFPSVLHNHREYYDKSICRNTSI